MSKRGNAPQIKICGITKKEEAEFLNEAGVDYAGFVFYRKSKRNVTFTQAKEIFPCLSDSIKKVAVFVSPTPEETAQAEEAGFDILQIHGPFSEEIIKKSRHPIWQAVNIRQAEESRRLSDRGEPEASGVGTERSEAGSRLLDGIAGLVLDGAEYGGGKAFDWEKNGVLSEYKKNFPDVRLILAGGLNRDNVAEGIRLFAPDVVDVSSGVENENGIGKNREKIMEFVRRVREPSVS